MVRTFIEMKDLENGKILQKDELKEVSGGEGSVELHKKVEAFAPGENIGWKSV